MDKILLIKIGITLIPFIILSVYSIINLVSISADLAKNEKKMITKRKIVKREDSNIYDLKARRN